MLIFTSRGPESLSRVLIEASALGVPIAAMNTGGTPDIVTHGETGLLSTTPKRSQTTCDGCADDERCGGGSAAAAARHADEHSTPARSCERSKPLYLDLLNPA